MATKFLLISTVLLSLLFPVFPLPSNSVSRATEILKNSNFVTMAALLEFGNQTLKESSTLTVFSPSDSTFASLGQPSLSSLEFHFSPLYFSSDTLKSLPYNSKIPSLCPNHYLIINSSPSDQHISLNSVKITEPPIFNDGSLIIFGINTFLNPYFKESYEPNATKVICTSWLTNWAPMNFDEAIKVLNSEGYSVMASFIGLQLQAIKRPTLLTVFAPVDKVMLSEFDDFSEYPKFFLRHVMPCRALWGDLADLEDGMELPTFLEGFKVSITTSDSCDGLVVKVNGVPIIAPNLYYNDWLVVHGVSDILHRSYSSQKSSSAFEIMILVAFSSLFLCSLSRCV